MKRIITLAALALLSVAAFAQTFTPKEQELIDLSNQKWAWMAEKNADALAKLFHENAQFVHMGGSWDKQQEVEIIRQGFIWYKKAEIHSQEVKFVEKDAIVYSNIHLTSEVGGNEVRFPFTVSEVYTKVKKEWKLGALIFTKMAEPEVPPVPYLTLNDGLLMPQFGIGTYQQTNEQAHNGVLTALRMGYRHIDTAHAYQDERGVGQAIKESGIPRNEIWLTSKIWPSEYGEGKTLEAIDKMLERLQVDYIDLLYVHQPMGDFVGAWKDMEKAVKAGKVRSLGVSNFDANDEVFDRIMAAAEIKPVALQIECHPYAQRKAIREKAAKYGIQVECWFPLGGSMSQGALFKDPVIMAIAEAHHKTPAQVILRWHLQEGFSVIPGSKTPAHIAENIDILDFALSDAEMLAIKGLDKEARFFQMDYEQAEQFMLNWKIED